MSARVPQNCLVQLVKDLADGDWCSAKFDAMSVDPDGEGWINPLAPCFRYLGKPDPNDLTGVTGLILEKVGTKVQVDLSRLGSHRYMRAPLPSLPEGEEWIAVASFVEPA